MLGKFLNIFGGDKPAPAAASNTPVTPTGASPIAPARSPRDIANAAIAEGNRVEDGGNPKAACDLYRKAIEADPGYARAHLNLGIGLDAAGDPAQALLCYEKALDLDPADAYANYNLGRALFSRNTLMRAEPLLRRAIELQPDFADARVVLSRLLENRKDLAGAAAELEKALQVRPDYFGALYNYADLLGRLGRLDEAESALQRAVALEPANFDTNFRLGMLLVQKDRGRDAERYFQQALRSKPDSVESRVALVNIHLAQNDLDAAVTQAEMVLKQRPDWVELLFDYGLILKRLARQAEAEKVFRRIIELDKAYARAYQMLGAVLTSQCRVKEALDVFADGRRNCTDTFDLESPEIFALNCLEDIPVEELFARHVDFGRRLEDQFPRRFARFENTREPGRRLRIGYLSADLQYHVVPLFLLPLLEERDRSAVEVYLYSAGDTADEYTERLRGLADGWRNVGRKTAQDVADIIHADRIDILIDLAGHSGVPSLKVFALQPAPVQATWVGYLNTTGLTRIHYRISDNQSDPPGLTDRYHTEKLVRLPHSQWCYRPFVEVENATEAPSVRNGYMTFGSFNQTVKITREVRRLWGRILTGVPDSRFVVVGVVDARAREDLFKDLEDAGVSRSRVTMAPYLPIEEYYRWYGKVDIALDTMPFSGGTTTCDSLWMGVPVVTAPGARSWSRSAASALTTVGLADWIASSPEDYVDRAVRFARDPVAIATLRTSLRQKMQSSPLMDKKLFARDMEQAYRGMWQTWCGNSGG